MFSIPARTSRVVRQHAVTTLAKQRSIWTQCHQHQRPNATTLRSVLFPKPTLRKFSTKATAPMFSTPVKVLLVIGGASAIGTVATMRYLNLELEDIQENVLDFLGMGEPAPTAQVITLPVLPTPDEYVHPYATKSWLWQWTFTIKRCLYLSWLLIPVARATAWLAWDSQSEKLLKNWCDTLVIYINTAGCSFQKFGQWISMRPDMFPPALIDATSQLRDDVPAHSYAETVFQIESTIGKKMDEMFEWVNPVCVASGSVGQVHQATLRPEFALADGTINVAIKVRHPSVLDETFVDLAIVFGLVPFLNTIVTLSGSSTRIAMPFSPESLFATIQKQLDFQWEAFNLIEFQRNFHREVKNLDKFCIKFPVVSVELLSDAVLIESWAPGKTVASMFEKLHTATEEVRGKLADTVFDITAKMFLRDNFIHGDMHAGNLLFHSETGVVTVMDAGLVTALPGDMFNAFGDFIRALCTKDIAEITDKLILFHDETGLNAVKQDSIDKVKLFEDVNDIFATGGGAHRPGTPAAQALGDILGDLLRRIGKHDVLLRGDIASCIMTISIAEGLIMLLDPNMDILEKSIPYFIKYRGWESAQEILQTGYVTSERTAKDLKEGLEHFVEETTEVIVTATKPSSRSAASVLETPSATTTATTSLTTPKSTYTPPPTKPTPIATTTTTSSITPPPMATTPQTTTTPISTAPPTTTAPISTTPPTTTTPISTTPPTTTPTTTTTIDNLVPQS